jgi:hypothetical protein
MKTVNIREVSAMLMALASIADQFNDNVDTQMVNDFIIRTLAELVERATEPEINE